MGERTDLPLPESAYTLHVVMVGIQHPGNLGAVCRSLLNHGFDSLRLVQPKCHPDDIEARNRAKHAGRILDTCKIYESFEEAIASKIVRSIFAKDKSSSDLTCGPMLSPS